MELWTTFCPSKICWEVTAVRTEGKSPSSRWLDHKDIIETSLKNLKTAGISGVRLVIYPYEITKDGDEFDWTASDTAIELCGKAEIRVILCVGPFQFPYYPGIYLPQNLLMDIPQAGDLDADETLLKYGMKSLETQIERYKNDNNIIGFHFSNEWPDKQNISGKEEVKKSVSPEFMKDASRLIKSLTDKPVFMNTNIDAGETEKLILTFHDLSNILEDQLKLGLDIYPSQEKWTKVPLQKFRRILIPYRRSFAKCIKSLDCEMFFAEVEAQPWGNGRSWYEIIRSESKPSEEILGYKKETLNNTFNKHIGGTSATLISLWGSDFWLTAYEMGIKWPLEAVKLIN